MEIFEELSTLIYFLYVRAGNKKKNNWLKGTEKMTQVKLGHSQVNISLSLTVCLFLP